MSGLAKITNRGRATLTGPAGTVTVSGPARVSLTGGLQGPSGPPGPMMGEEDYEAAENIGGHRAVALDSSGLLIPADASEGIAAIGIIRDAVTTGNDVTVYRAGVVNGFTGLTPAAVYYLGESGAITLTPPTSGILQPLGTAASATELLVDPDYPTEL